MILFCCRCTVVPYHISLKFSLLFLSFSISLSNFLFSLFLSLLRFLCFPVLYSWLVPPCRNASGLVDGAAESALFADPQGITVSETHNCLFICDYTYVIHSWCGVFPKRLIFIRYLFGLGTMSSAESIWTRMRSPPLLVCVRSQLLVLSFGLKFIHAYSVYG